MTDSLSMLAPKYPSLGWTVGHHKTGQNSRISISPGHEVAVCVSTPARLLTCRTHAAACPAPDAAMPHSGAGCFPG